MSAETARPRSSTQDVFQWLSLGLVAFALGLVGLLKTAIERREHHRLDRQPTTTLDRSQA